MDGAMTTKLPVQPDILAPVPPCGQSLVFRMALESDPRPVLARLREGFDPAWGVVGLGDPLMKTIGAALPGLRPFPALSGPGCSVPSTQAALWVFLRGEERGEVFDRCESTRALLGDAFVLEEGTDVFVYAGGRDLTGYEDGTENPQGDEAVAAALVASGTGMAGSSYVAVQRWVHDLEHFRGHPQAEQDDIIGRRRADNEEFDEAPASAHVKRAAQESFEPEAFMLRRSMPWAGAQERGLVFVAFGADLDRYERVLRRMAGLEDGISDALFTFSRPVTGGYYWCPPLKAGHIDLSACGL
jgi:putative iron-dependent peroxidase